MTTITDHSCLGFQNLTVANVPQSAEEYDTLAGKPGVCLEDAIDNTLYRSWNAEFRKGMSESLAKSESFPRIVEKQSNPKKDGSTTPIYESEKKHLGRYLAAQVEAGNKPEDVMKSLTPLAQAVANSLKFDPKPSARGGSGVGKEFHNALNSYLAGVGDTEDNRKSFASKIEALNPGFIVALDENGVPTNDGLAAGIKANSERKAKESVAELAA